MPTMLPLTAELYAALSDDERLCMAALAPLAGQVLHTRVSSADEDTLLVIPTGRALYDAYIIHLKFMVYFRWEDGEHGWQPPQTGVSLDHRRITTADGTIIYTPNGYS